jgi:hypothetical protein
VERVDGGVEIQVIDEMGIMVEISYWVFEGGAGPCEESAGVGKIFCEDY